MRLLHELAKISVTFDDPHLVSQAGLVPVMALAQRAALGELAGEHVRISRPCGVNAQLKVPCLVAGMAAGADSIEDMGLLRHGAMPAVFGGLRASSTLGSFLQAFTWGNVLQLGKVHRELLGTHQGSVNGAHLPAYLDEFIFRFNRRRPASAAWSLPGAGASRRAPLGPLPRPARQQETAPRTGSARLGPPANTAVPARSGARCGRPIPQERLNRELRRRTDVVGIFPSRAAIIRLAGAVLMEQNDEWAEARRYIGIEILAKTGAAATPGGDTPEEVKALEQLSA